jgi:hypothetical protein
MDIFAFIAAGQHDAHASLWITGWIVVVVLMGATVIHLVRRSRNGR